MNAACKKTRNVPGATPSLGAVSADQCLPLTEFCRLTGIGRWGLYAAQKRGLKVSKVGRRKFILGSDWLAFVASHRDE
jgi:hypothetical protein